jgi:hypothetical protein
MITRRHETLFGHTSATFSACERYRFDLVRQWGAGPTVCFVMLNPSTADEREDDPTIRRCLAFARRESAGRLVVVNLFAWRATDPAALRSAVDPVGTETDRIIADHAVHADLVVCAWGVHGALLGRGADVMARLEGLRLRCLGRTKDGHPKHPLYLRSDAALEVYS